MTNATKLMGAWGGVAWLAMGLLGSFIPGAGLLGFVGMILVVVAMFRASGELRRPAISKSMVISVGLSVAVLVVFFIFAGSAALAMIHSGEHTPGVGFGAGMIGGCLVAWLLLIGASWFWYQALKEIAEGSGIAMFRTAGLVYFIGVLTIIVFGLGVVAMLVGQVLQIVAFFSVPDEQPSAAAQA